MKVLVSAIVALAALQAHADAPGPFNAEAEKAAASARQGAVPSNVPVTSQRTADGRRVITNQGDSTAMVNLLNRSMPALRAREAQDFREQEALRREREAEREAALIHHTECFRQWGEATCAPKPTK